MQAADIMTTNVISVKADTTIKSIASCLVKHRISAVPVVDENKQIIGIVSEGDLMRRPEIETDNKHSWWLAEILSTRDRAADYIKAHGRKASDVMSRAVISVADDTPVYEIAELLEKHHIKRVPVIRDGQLVGIVSRANLLHALASQEARKIDLSTPDDKAIREDLMREITVVAGIDAPLINAVVTDGVVQLYGVVDTPQKKQAVQVAAENVAGIKSIENNLSRVPPWFFAN
jgi:CBS domain-containing protein